MKTAFAAAALAAGILATVAYAGVVQWTRTAGVTCGFGTGPHGRGVACSLSSGTGYAVTLTRGEVIVWAPDGHKAFQHRQP